MQRAFALPAAARWISAPRPRWRLDARHPLAGTPRPRPTRQTRILFERQEFLFLRLRSALRSRNYARRSLPHRLAARQRRDGRSLSRGRLEAWADGGVEISAEVAGTDRRGARAFSPVKFASRDRSRIRMSAACSISARDGGTFLTMEFVDGEDLASLMRRIGRLPADKPSRSRASLRWSRCRARRGVIIAT